MPRIAAPYLGHAVLLASLAWLSVAYGQAQPMPVPILDARISGHVHPSICRTDEGRLVVVYRGSDVLMGTHSNDQGRTWSAPRAIPTTAQRPETIRAVKKYEVYPGTVDTLPDGRLLLTWNYIADDKAQDGYYERALLYSISDDEGQTWSPQKVIGPLDGRHLGAVRHNVLPWTDGRWLLPLRTGPPRLFDPATNQLSVWPVRDEAGNQHEFQQVVRTTDGTLLAMGPVLLRSTDQGSTWRTVEAFPAGATERDNLEGRYLTALDDGGVLVTWGVGHDNRGLRYNYSPDNGLTWNASPRVLLPETPIAARYYSARTIQLGPHHVGTVYMNSKGIHFLRVPLELVTKGSD